MKTLIITPKTSDAKSAQIHEMQRAIGVAAQMLGVNISAMRASIVLDKPEMMVDILNEMDKTVIKMRQISN